jgi:hypothetical protein
MTSKHTSFFFFSFAFALCSLQVSAQYITTFAGVGTAGYSGDGTPCFEAQLNHPTGIATYGYVTQYIADEANHVIRKVDNLHNISTFAGSVAGTTDCNNCNANAAKLISPYGIAVDGFNNVYIADFGANVVRKVNTSGIILTVAGTGTAGYTGDGGPALSATLDHPYAVALDVAGNLYISDAQNNVIRKVDGTGKITTFAGTGYGAGLTTGHGDYTGDGGPATAARLNFPEGLGTDKFGNLFIADVSNNVIRKVDANKNITTCVGSGVAGYTGDGGAAKSARLNFPSGVAADGLGNIYIADQGNNAIRKVTIGGVISTIAGTFTAGYFGDGALAVNAQLNHPAGITVDGNGLVYFADYGNSVIRLIGPASIVNAVQPVHNAVADVKVYPNPSNGSFTVEIPQTGNAATITVTDMVGRIIQTKTIEGTIAQQVNFNLSNIPSGNYILKINSGDLTFRDKIVIW